MQLAYLVGRRSFSSITTQKSGIVPICIGLVYADFPFYKKNVLLSSQTSHFISKMKNSRPNPPCPRNPQRRLNPLQFMHQLGITYQQKECGDD